MVAWSDVGRLALALPEVVEGSSYGRPAWDVRRKTFAWERPLTGKDRRDLGERAPDGDLLGVRTEHLHAKEAVLAAHPDVVLTTPHFDGFPAVLVQLEHVDEALLEELLGEAWLAMAPKKLAAAFLAGR